MLDGPVVGLTAALLAPLLMTVGFIVWDKYWTGSAFALNVFKCGLASTLFLIVVVASTGGSVASAFPPAVYTSEAVGFLTLSAFMGITVGDVAWLKALKLLGAKRVIIIDMLKPFLAALLGAVFLGEDVEVLMGLGIALTSIGILVVSLEKEKEKKGPGAEESAAVPATAAEPADPERAPEEKAQLAETLLDVGSPAAAWGGQGIGYLLAASNVLLDACGALLTKKFGSALQPDDICLIRFGSAFGTMAVVWGLSRLALWWSSPSWSAWLGDGRWCQMPTLSAAVWGRITAGVLFVTFLCPMLSNLALLNLALALTLTLTSLGPLYALPLVWLMKGERITLRAMAGSLLAVGGVALCWIHARG